MKIGVTGHRLERIGDKYKIIEEWLNQQIKKLKGQYGENIVLLTGMAQGIDQMAAIIAIKNGVQIKCYFPYKHKLSAVEEYIADNAAEVRYECERYQKDCYLKRDRRIVDDCDLLIVVWDGIKNGGTYYTWKYASEIGKNMLIFPWEQEKITEYFDAVEDEFND